MDSTRTTPPRPLDVAAVFPELGPLARPAVRLHPRLGSPTPRESSVGGPLLWPADHPWPYCDMWHEGPERSPLVPVAQLYARDVPLLRSFGKADLLQVLWCTSEHEPESKPSTALFWWTAADVTDVRTAPPPEPSYVEFDGLIPQPCVLAPEHITEYPNFLDLSEELREQLADRGAWRAAGVAVDDCYATAPQSFYTDQLSMAPGWKVGGWPPWGRTDPVARFCVHCGAAMRPLLTIASSEWDGGTGSWVPYEDQSSIGPVYGGKTNSPGVVVGSWDHLQIYVCPNAPDWGHGHTDLIQ